MRLRLRSRFIPVQQGCDVPTGETVYLLHGFGGRPAMMGRMATFLRRHGYRVQNWSYPTLRKNVAAQAELLWQELQLHEDANDGRPIHFVTHSLGGIVVRQMLCRFRPQFVGRVVMVAPPNLGSHVARVSSIFLSRLCPVLGELSDRRGSLVSELDDPDHAEIGVIAGAGDWVVWRHRTHLGGQRDHIVLSGGHLRLPLLRTCSEQALHFLMHGQFCHEERVARMREGSERQRRRTIRDTTTATAIAEQ